MLVNLKLRTDLFGNHYLEIENKISLKINLRDYEDISYILIKKENKLHLEQYKDINTVEILEICKENILCSTCPFTNEHNQCCVRFISGNLVVNE